MTRRSQRAILLTFSALAVLVVAVASLSWWAASSAPAYWQKIDRDDPGVVQRAAAVENFISTQATSARPDMDRWSVELTQDQVNAWLAARLPLWLANQGVDPRVIEFFPNLLVHVADKKVEFAAELKLNGDKHIVRFVYLPTPQKDSEPVKLDLEGVYAGRLPLPVDWTIERIKDRLSDQGRGQADKLRLLLESIKLQLPLEDGRTVKVIHVDITDGKAILTCQTDLKRAAQASAQPY